MRLLKLFKNEKGITLIEILTVTVIIGLLGTLIAPKLNSFTNKSQVGVVETDMRLLKSNIQEHFVDNPTQPLNINLLKKYFGTNVVKVSGTDPVYYRLPDKKDPWGNPYQVIVGSSELYVAIHSFGPDSKNNITAGISATNLGDDVLALFYPQP